MIRKPSLQIRLSATVLTLALLLPLFVLVKVHAAGTISGRVFQDFNGNGTYDTTATLANNGTGGTGTVALPVDVGVAGVTVSAYDSAGVWQGSTTTAANGTYSLAALGTGPYRIEFTTLPNGYSPSTRTVDSLAPGGTATNSASTVQFVPDGASTNVNLAVNHPTDYCQNNPEIAASMYVPGDNVIGANNGLPALQSFPYSAGSSDLAAGAAVAQFDQPLANPFDIAANQVGTTVGLAYGRKSRLLYAGAYFKRHAGFGPGGPNAIYKLSRTGTGSVTGTITVPGTATNQHDTTNYNRDNCPGCGNTVSYVGWDSIGKSSLGGVAISDDETKLYTWNLANRTLYSLDPATGALITSQATLPALPLAVGNCPAGDVRPFALEFYKGTLYSGFVCSAESSATVDVDSNGGSYVYGEWFRDDNLNNVREVGEPYWDVNGSGTYNAGEAFTDNDGNGIYNLGDSRNLRAYVFAVDPTTLAFTSPPLVNVPLNYRRSFVNDMAGGTATWFPWTPTYRNTSNRPLQPSYPQPMLTDIAFDGPNLVLGLRDRMGDQVGNNANSNPADANLANLYLTYPGGDILRLCSVAGVLTLESNGRCNGLGSATQNTNMGPGRAEYYFGDSFTRTGTLVSPATTILGKGSNHDEVTLGGVEQLPGAPDVMSTILDPIPEVSSAISDGGIRWLNNSTGDVSKAFRQYDGAAGGTTFGKSAGVGGSIKVMCDPAPLELGNRVWMDTDGDGVQDPGEMAIAGVTVRLYNASNTLIATAVTDANGEYYFIGGTGPDADITNNIGIVNGPIGYNTNYQIRFDLAANYGAGGPLQGKLLTTKNQISQLGFDAGSDSDASLVTNPTGSPAGTFPVIAVTTGNPGDNNHNLDAGFTNSAVFSIGNRVWFDTNNNGQVDGTEVGISGVSVSCFLDANADGTPDTPGSPVATVITDASGYYRCDNLAANNYVVRINGSNFGPGGVLAGTRNTTGANATDLDSTSVVGQNGENGIDPTGATNGVITTGVLSATIALGAPGEPTNEADIQASGQGAIDAAANMTVDFGFYKLCVSGTLFNDRGPGAQTNNGIFDAGEATLSGRTVRIYDSAGVEIPVGPDGILGTADDATGGIVTNASGNYNFCGLLPGQYRITVTPYAGDASSTPTSLNPDDNIDNNDDGSPGAGAFTGRYVSGLVTLTPGSTGALGNNTVTNATGTTANPTVDFGIVAVILQAKLENFEALNDGEGTQLRWRTGDEVSNLGFNIYREVNGIRELVNPAPILGSSLRASVELRESGDVYAWTDERSDAGAVYFLEDIDLEGRTTLHGPIKPNFVPDTKRSRNSSLLTDLSKPRNISVRESVSLDGNSRSSRLTKQIVATRQETQRMIAANGGATIHVNHDGWYRVSSEELIAAGFSISSDQRRWQLFNDGVEVPIRTNADGSIEFFGHGIDVRETDKNAYYLIVGRAQGSRITTTQDAGSENFATYFDSTIEVKPRSVYASGILNGDEDNWFGPIILKSGPTVQNFAANDLSEGPAATVRVKLQGLTNIPHSVGINLNGQFLGNVQFTGRENREFSFSVASSVLRSGDNSLSLQSFGEGSDSSLLDSVTVTYGRRFIAQGDSLRFKTRANEGVQVSGFSNGEIRVFEVENGKVGRELLPTVSGADGNFAFTLAPASREREFFAISSSRIASAFDVVRNSPSSYTNRRMAANLVILSPARFISQSSRLADLRRSQGFRTVVVNVEDIYDEFSFGIPSAAGLSGFFAAAADSWKIGPQFAILFGDSSYDMRGYWPGENHNLVPTKMIDATYLETSSDSSYVDFNKDGVEDIAIGRLPVSNETEADGIVAKLERYAQQNSARLMTTRRDILASDNEFVSANDTIAASLPAGVVPVRVERSTLGDSEMRLRLLDAINSGNPNVVTFTGHGSTSLWSSNGIFNSDDASALTNSAQTFWIMTSCLNAYSIHPSVAGLAEAAVNNPNGGAIAVAASTGLGASEEQLPLALEATRLFFGPQTSGMRIGNIVRLAKQTATGIDVRRTWQLTGDPTLIIR